MPVSSHSSHTAAWRVVSHGSRVPPGSSHASASGISPLAGHLARTSSRPAQPATLITAGPLAGMYDGGHGADELLESLDRLGFAGDVDVAVRSGEDEGAQGLGGRGDR